MSRGDDFDQTIDGDENVQINARGDVISSIGDGAMAAGRDITIINGVPYDKHEEKINELKQKMAKMEIEIDKLKEIPGANHKVIAETRLAAEALSLGRLDDAKIHFKRAKIDAEKSGDNHLVGGILNHIAHIYQTEGLIRESENLYLKSLDMAQKHGSEAEQVKVLYNLSTSYAFTSQKVKCKQVLDEAFTIIIQEHFNSRIIKAMIYLALSGYYRNFERDSEKASLYANNGLELLDEEKGATIDAEYRNALVVAYSEKLLEVMDSKDLAKTKTYFDKIMLLASQDGDYVTMSTTYSNYSRFIMEVSSDSTLALGFALKSKKFADESLDFQAILSSMLTIFYCHLNFENIKDAKIIYSEIKNSLSSKNIEMKQWWEKNVVGFPFEFVEGIFG